VKEFLLSVRKSRSRHLMKLGGGEAVMGKGVEGKAKSMSQPWKDWTGRRAGISKTSWG
jgi:hypothetical protein